MEKFIDALTGRTVVAPDVYTADIVSANLLLAFILAVIIAYTYKKVHKGVSYSQSYVFSIVIISMTVALAMMVIGNDITRAFALLGTFTIIRYRTAVKDPRDLAFVFIALVVGLAVGSSNYSIAIVGTVVMCIAALLLHIVNFGAAVKTEQVLYLTVKTKLINLAKLEEIMHRTFKHSTMLNVNYVKDGDILMYSYSIQLRSESDNNKFIEEITTLRGVESAEVLSSQNLIEF